MTQTELLAYQKKKINVRDKYGNTFEKVADVIIVRPEIKELGKVFGVSICDLTCENFSDVANKIRTQENKFLVLLDKIKEWFSAYESLNNNNIDFVDLYSDKLSLNRMIKGLRSYYYPNIKDKYGRIFLPLQTICQNFAYDLKIEKRKSDLQEMIEERDELLTKVKESSSLYDRQDYEYKYKDKKEQVAMEYTLIQSFEQVNCFSRETFAMLYLRLEPYVQKENAILSFLQKEYFEEVTE